VALPRVGAEQRQGVVRDRARGAAPGRGSDVDDRGLEAAAVLLPTTATTTTTTTTAATAGAAANAAAADATTATTTAAAARRLERRVREGARCVARPGELTTIGRQRANLNAPRPQAQDDGRGEQHQRISPPPPR